MHIIITTQPVGVNSFIFKISATVVETTNAAGENPSVPDVESLLKHSPSASGRASVSFHTKAPDAEGKTAQSTTGSFGGKKSAKKVKGKSAAPTIQLTEAISNQESNAMSQVTANTDELSAASHPSEEEKPPEGATAAPTAPAEPAADKKSTKQSKSRKLKSPKSK